MLRYFLHGNYEILALHWHHHLEQISTIDSKYHLANCLQPLGIHLSNPEHYHMYYLLNLQKLAYNFKNLKFVTFLPNVKEAKKPFAGVPSTLFLYAINIWLLVDVIAEGRIFPVKLYI